MKDISNILGISESSADKDLFLLRNAYLYTLTIKPDGARMASLYEHYSHILELAFAEQESYLQPMKWDDNDFYQRLRIRLNKH